MTRTLGLLAILTLTLSSCQFSICDYEYYEEVSGVDLPRDFDEIDCIDNGEYLTAAVLRIDLGTVEQFIDKNGFEKVPDDFEANFAGQLFLNKDNLDIPSSERLYLLQGKSETNKWYFLLDRQTGRLWAQVLYPDWAGDPPE